MFLRVISKPQQWGGLGPSRAVARKKKKITEKITENNVGGTCDVLRLCTETCLEALRKNTKKCGHSCGSEDRDLNPEPPTYETDVLLP